MQRVRVTSRAGWARSCCRHPGECNSETCSVPPRCNPIHPVSLKTATLFVLGASRCLRSPSNDRSDASDASDDAHDIVISNGRVVDGTGAPWFRADVGIRGDRVVRIGDLQTAATQQIDATNLVVAPGFIECSGSRSSTSSWITGLPARFCKA